MSAPQEYKIACTVWTATQANARRMTKDAARAFAAWAQQRALKHRTPTEWASVYQEYVNRPVR